MNIKTTLKASVAAAAIFAAAPAFAGEVTDGNAGLKIGGGLAWGVMFEDNGQDDGFKYVDLGSNMNFTAKAPVSETLTVGAYLNLEVQTNRNDDFGISQEGTTSSADADDIASDNTVDIDRSNISFAHASAGTLTIGKHSEAADGILSGNAGSGIANTNLRFHIANTTSYSAVDMDNYTYGGDGGDGYVVRYDSPNFAGAVLSISDESDQGTDIALRYSNTFGDIGVGVNVAHRFMGAASSSIDSYTLGNVKLSHASGFSVDGRYGTSDATADGRKDHTVWGIGAGYTAALSDLGSTTFSGGYNVHEEVQANGDELTNFGFGVSQAIDAAGAKVYANYGNSDLKVAAGTNYDDIMTFVVGASVNF